MSTTQPANPKSANPKSANLKSTTASRIGIYNPRVSTKEHSQQFLSLHLPRQQQAMVPTDSLIEVLTMSPNQIIPIPDTPSEVMGVCNWRGEVLWLIDAGHLLGDAASFVETDYQTKFSVVVVQRQNRSIGLVVDRVGDMVWCLHTEIRSVESDQAHARCLLGTWQLPDDDRSFFVLDADLILNLFA
jgi:positive phototaxis protein PixI